MILKNPQLLVNFVGQTIPSVSLYFVDMVIVKIFTAVPLEMIRPWQIITIHLISRCMDRRKTTRRDLRTGAFYAWPMLYGWIYPQVTSTRPLPQPPTTTLSTVSAHHLTYIPSSTCPIL